MLAWCIGVNMHHMRTRNTTAPPKRVHAFRFYGDSFVLNVASGMFYRLSPAADFLLRALDEGASIDQFPDLIVQRYGVERTTAVRDSELLLNQFNALGLLDSFATT